MTSDDLDIATVATELLAAAVEATPEWVRRCVDHVAREQALLTADLPEAAVADAGVRAQDFVETRLGALLALDIDRQRTTPLSISSGMRCGSRSRRCMRWGAAPVHRGDVSRWAFPNDPFGITPGNLSDIG